MLLLASWYLWGLYNHHGLALCLMYYAFFLSLGESIQVHKCHFQWWKSCPSTWRSHLSPWESPQLYMMNRLTEIPSHMEMDQSTSSILWGRKIHKSQLLCSWVFFMFFPDYPVVHFSRPQGHPFRQWRKLQRRVLEKIAGQVHRHGILWYR